MIVNVTSLVPNPIPYTANSRGGGVLRKTPCKSTVARSNQGFMAKLWKKFYKIKKTKFCIVIEVILNGLVELFGRVFGHLATVHAPLPARSPMRKGRGGGRGGVSMVRGVCGGGGRRTFLSCYAPFPHTAGKVVAELLIKYIFVPRWQFGLKGNLWNLKKVAIIQIKCLEMKNKSKH